MPTVHVYLFIRNSIFLVLGLNPRTRNCYLWDQMLSSNPIFGLRRELMSLQLMLLPNLTQNKKVFYHKISEENLRFWELIPESIKCYSGIGSCILRDQSPNSILWSLGQCTNEYSNIFKYFPPNMDIHIQFVVIL